ncbi:MAG TPA: hypothetical protein PKE58_10890, partial [Acidobacteriota bacterium]|nr:hypothetical protein [Acidobacteriota bacterium]
MARKESNESRTQPEVVKRFSLRLTQTEADRITDLATRWREPKAQALRRVIDLFRLGHLPTTGPLVIPFTLETASCLFMA